MSKERKKKGKRKKKTIVRRLRSTFSRPFQPPFSLSLASFDSSEGARESILAPGAVRKEKKGQESAKLLQRKDKCLTVKEKSPRSFCSSNLSLLSLSPLLLLSPQQQERQAEWLLRDFDAAGAVPVSVLLNYLRAELAVS